jgi:hypothetical protein
MAAQINGEDGETLLRQPDRIAADGAPRRAIAMEHDDAGRIAPGARPIGRGKADTVGSPQANVLRWRRSVEGIRGKTQPDGGGARKPGESERQREGKKQKNRKSPQ